MRQSTQLRRTDCFESLGCDKIANRQNFVRATIAVTTGRISESDIFVKCLENIRYGYSVLKERFKILK